MARIPENILFLMIARRQRLLTEEEELLFQSWLYGCEGRAREMKDMQQMIEDCTLAELQHNINWQKAWKRVNQQTSNTAAWRRRQIVRMRWNVAAVLLPLLVVGGTLGWLLWGMSGQLPVTGQVEICPGEAQAELVLAGGERIVLKNAGKQQIIDRHGELVGVDSVNHLIYVSRKTKTEEWNILRTPQGGEYRLILPDGTQVWLNSGSRLKFPDRFIGLERQVELEGEAFFDVIQDIAHPFVVKTAYSKVKVLGTSFNVSCYSGETTEQTTLVEGRVEVLIGGQVMELQPGKQLHLDVRTQVAEVYDVDVQLYTSWKDGIFRFCDLPLEELARKLERWYDVHFFFMQTDCRKIRFTGAIRKYADFHEFIRLIESTTDVKFDVKGNTITIQKK